MRSLRLFLLCLLAMPMSAFAQAKLNVVATTEDLGALAREIGGDKVSVTALAKGYQDPHFVDPKPSFILAVSKADGLIVVGRELEIGWLPPLLTSSRNGKIQLGANGYLDASLNVKILELPTGEITRAMGQIRDKIHRVMHYISTRFPGRMIGALAEHEAIASALLDGDGPAAAQRMATHLRNGLQSIYQRDS